MRRACEKRLAAVWVNRSTLRFFYGLIHELAHEITALEAERDELKAKLELCKNALAFVQKEQEE